jgi:polar amino acid transport system substrate-binding protein
MVRPDDSLKDAVDQAMQRLSADGTVARIYQRYGVTLQIPK